MLGSDGVSRFGLGFETSHFSSLSLEGLTSCLGHKYIRLRFWVLQQYGLVKLL